jgi:DNA-binding MarR family transcriptional regulator
MTAGGKKAGGRPRLAEIGLANYPPYLMNRIMGRYNAAIRAEMGKLGLTTPKMRALAVLSVMDGVLMGQLAVHAIVEQSTLSRAVDALEAEGLVRRVADAADSRAVRVFISDTGRRRLKACGRIWPTRIWTWWPGSTRTNCAPLWRPCRSCTTTPRGRGFDMAERGVRAAACADRHLIAGCITG